ncbi:hypothetical protein GTW43_22795 [Streptomyces sp. SID5785]|uniref:DUF6332 family protein n=1 Tax=Streptomyces sp. SID5785 TaxID=2690309 RepID=UPI001361C149|nr:DUF6332 family protein [Streptomyces sp. SID5785]MZD07889.1 hypothetical protein [Streptomyces sp. SID5785]
MTTARARRTQAERDAATVETVSALFSSSLFAGAAFLVVFMPVLYGLVPDGTRSAVTVAAGVAAGVAFVGRLVEGLWGFGRGTRG